jgi:hypothetical protein
MKKLFTALVLALSATATMAQHHGHHGHHHRHHGGNHWVAPLVIGGVIGYGLTRPHYEPYYAPPPVVYVPPPVYQSNCTRYIYQDQNGQTIKEEIRCN